MLMPRSRTQRKTSAKLKSETHSSIKPKSITTTNTLISPSKHTTSPLKRPSKSVKKWTLPSCSSKFISSSTISKKSRTTLKNATNSCKRVVIGKEKTDSKSTKEFIS